MIILKDLETGEIDAIILNKTSTVNKIENCIRKMKEENESEYQWEDLIKCLPNDCALITQFEEVYY